MVSHYLLNVLVLVIGSEKVPRYSCAAHKLNLVIRKAIKENDFLSNMLKELSSLGSKSTSQYFCINNSSRKKNKASFGKSNKVE